VFDNIDESSGVEPPCVSLDEVVERPLSVIALLVVVESAFGVGIVEEKLVVIVVMGVVGMEPLCVTEAEVAVTWVAIGLVGITADASLELEVAGGIIGIVTSDPGSGGGHGGGGSSGVGPSLGDDRAAEQSVRNCPKELANGRLRVTKHVLHCDTDSRKTSTVSCA